MLNSPALASAIPRDALVRSTLSLACAVLVGFSALVRFPVPGSPVPATLQTFALLACAGMLGWRYALQMAGWYLALGLAGAPFFAGAGLGVTGGYLAGFVAAAAVAGFAGRRTLGIAARCALFIAAALAIYAPGLIWLKAATGAGWGAALAMGLYPFIFADVVKAVAAALAVHASVRWYGPNGRSRAGLPPPPRCL
ncbi:MAG: biotin transporter BioY [Proteobacteria bacterium]|nr:biotin transporter BioY [Pseudomonadota bacterium]